MATNKTAPLRRVQVFVPADLATRIQAAARADERSESQTIRRLVEKALREETA